MATIDWPEALIPQTAQFALRKAGLQFVSPFNGTLQAVDFIAERWTLSASLAQMSARNPRGVHAFCNTLAGGVERVRVWPFHTGGVPRGALRGSPVLASTLNRGATSLSLSNATSTNIFLGGSFEFDTNSDGLADGWAGYQAGSVGAVTYGLTQFIPQDGINEQFIIASTLGVMSTDVAGIFRSVEFAADPGWLTASVRVRSQGGPVRAYLDLRFETLPGVVLGNVTFGDVEPGFPGIRIGGSVLPPPGTRRVVVALAMASRSGPNTSRETAWDAMSLQLGQVSLAWPGRGSLQAGDFIGAGGQLLQVASDCLANDAGGMTVPLVNRLRGSVAAGSPVAWYRPTCEMVMPAMQAGPVHRPGAIESTALDLVEVW